MSLRLSAPRAALAALLLALCLLATLAPAAGAAERSAQGYYSPLIVIPSIGVHQKAQRTLATGPIVYYFNPATGTIGIAGHNVTPVAGYDYPDGQHGPFHHLKFIRVGADVWVNHVHYRVVRKLTIRNTPAETRQVLSFHGVVLSACYPDHSAAYRTVALAKQVGVVG